MYNFLVEEIRKRLSEDTKYVRSQIVMLNYLLLIYLKYLCNNKNIKNYIDNVVLLNAIPEIFINLYNPFFSKKLNELLVHLELSNIDDLVNEFIKNTKIDTLDEIDNILINENEKVIYYFNIIESKSKLLNSIPYNDIKLHVKMLEMLDEMTNNKRLICTSINEVNLEDINTLVIIDREPAYRYTSPKNIIEVIYNLYLDRKEFNGKIILKTSYSKISIMKDNYVLNKLLSKVILYEDSKKNECILIFDKETKKDISIILINKDIESDYNKIKEIINKNIANKKRLIKVTSDDIIKNNYRIGFKMYLPNKKEDAKSINDIIDENTRILNKITDLNKLIQQEMDKLVSK